MPERATPEVRRAFLTTSQITIHVLLDAIAACDPAGLSSRPITSAVITLAAERSRLLAEEFGSDEAEDRFCSRCSLAKEDACYAGGVHDIVGDQLLDPTAAEYCAPCGACRCVCDATSADDCECCEGCDAEGSDK